MAEYIEREALLELINEDCKYKNPTNEYTRGCNEVCDWAIKTIKNIPTADVVPMAEVEQLKRNLEQCENGYRQEMHLLQCKLTNAKSEVASEVLEEIKKYITPNKVGLFNNIYIADVIYEVKKKYTEEKK